MKILEKAFSVNISPELTEDELVIFIDALDDRKRIIEWFMKNSQFLGKWSVTLVKLLLTEIKKKKSQNLPYEEENAIMNTLSGFLTKMSYYGESMSDWSSELAEIKEKMNKILEQKTTDIVVEVENNAGLEDK
jgi:hypothetical protein